MKLYTVRATFKYVVVANNAEDAFLVAEDFIPDAFSDLSRSDVDLNITDGVTDSNWDDECIPYGGDGETRTGEYK